MNVRFAHLLTVLSFFFIVMVGVVPLAAQPEDTALLRWGVFIPGSDTFLLELNGEPSRDTQGSVRHFGFGHLLSVREAVPAGETTLAFFKLPQVATPFVSTTTTLEAGSHYIVALVSPLDSDASEPEILVINESELLTGVDFETQGAAIYLNALVGAPPLTLQVGTQTLFSNLGFADYVLSSSATFTDQPILLTAQSVDEPLVEESGGSRIAGVYAFIVVAGTYSGDVNQDFGPISFREWRGDLTTEEGGAVAVGESAQAELMMGARIRYRLTLDAATRLVLTQTGTEAWADAHLRLYDAASTLIAEHVNDFDDNRRIARIETDELAPGEYIIEVGSFSDVVPDRYTISVEAAE